MKKIKGGVSAPCGFKAAGLTCGIKRSGKPDLALIFSEVPAVTSGVFTKNKVKAAPILISMKNIRSGRAQAIIANSGNANCSTGKQGLADAQEMVDVTAEKLKIDPRSVLVTSTGSIGKLLPIEKIIKAIPRLVSKLSSKGGHEVARAIMTTDLKAKEIAIKIGSYIVGGVAKGSGMIHPDLATMHAFITTDAAVDRRVLDRVLRSAVDKSFNMITVDKCMSTNDCVFIMANGKSGVKLQTSNALRKFQAAIDFVCTHLAKQIAQDGEGATKLITCEVIEAASLKDARCAAREVVGSDLLKAAIFGEDPNWGRIIAALGACDIKFDPDRTDVYLGDMRLVKNGQENSFSLRKVKSQMKKKEIFITCDLKQGQHSAEAWGCDLSYDYVKINARYHT